MLKNQRPYQLAYYKTHLSLPSAAVAWGAKMAAAVGFWLKSWPRAGMKVDSTTLPQRAATVYPKPCCQTEISPLPEADDSIDLSVIVPAYNVEKYIASCVDSVLTQQTQYRIELIVVNDNSTDGTAAALAPYGERDNVTLIDFARGGCAAKARNEGLRYAHGRYIMFLDADDKLCEHAVEQLLTAAEKRDADIVQGGWQYIFEDDSRGVGQQYLDMEYVGRHSADRFDLPGMPWGKVYRRGLFAEIRFPAGYTAFEDTIIHFLVFRSAAKVVSIAPIVYLWRKNSGGITAGAQNQPKALQSYYIMEEMLNENDRLGLPRDRAFAISLTLQLTCFCYANVRGFDSERLRLVFELCCDLYAKARIDDTHSLPLIARAGRLALTRRRFDLWCLQGKLSTLLR